MHRVALMMRLVRSQPPIRCEWMTIDFMVRPTRRKWALKSLGNFSSRGRVISETAMSDGNWPALA
jgi:hypothetical protein